MSANVKSLLASLSVKVMVAVWLAARMLWLVLTAIVGGVVSTVSGMAGEGALSLPAGSVRL